MTRNSIHQTPKTFRLIILTLFIILALSNLHTKAQDFQFNYTPVDLFTSGRIALGDMDSDGFNDIIVHTWGDCRGMTPNGTLIWYRYPDWEKFTIQTDRNFFGDEIVAVDIDKDGDIDIVAPRGQATSANTCPGSVKKTFGEIYIYENLNGSGTEWGEHFVGLVDNLSEVKEIHVHDLDKDGKPDISVRAAVNMVVFYQNTLTSWEKQTVAIVKREGSALSDIDGDGFTDFIANGYWLRNPGNRSDLWPRYNIDPLWYTSPAVGPPLNDAWRDDAVKVSVADLDKDGVDDLIFSHSEHKGFNVTWYKKTGDPITQQTEAWEKHNVGVVDFAHSLQTADFDNNGTIDILAGSTVWKGLVNGPYTAGNGDLVIFSNNGSGNFTRNQIDNKHVYSAVVGDIDNDGDIDIVAPRCWAAADNSFSAGIDLTSIDLWRNTLIHKVKQNLDKWTYKEVYTNRKRYGNATTGTARLFGLGIDDVNGDGRLDIIAGRELHVSPSGNINGSWTTINLPQPETMDCGIFLDVNNDQLKDIIGFDLEASGSIYWLEAGNANGTSWTPHKITLSPAIPVPGHRNPQGYAVAKMFPDGAMAIVIEAGDYITNDNGIYIIEVEYPETTWKTHKISGVSVGGNGLAVGDIDGDGLPDVFTGFKDLPRNSKGSDPGPFPVYWLKNPGNFTQTWQAFNVDTFPVGYMPDRFAIADIDNDGRNDLIVAEESYPITGGMSAYWYKAPLNPEMENDWGTKRLIIENGESFNSMEVTDMDGDGNVDVVIADMGLTQNGRVFIAENDGSGQFTIHKIHEGVESHGLKVADIDNDGDKDIVSIAWNNPSCKTLRLWINGYIEKGDETGSAGDTIAYWSFNQSEGILVPDISGNTHHLQLTGGATLSMGKAGNALALPATPISYAIADDATLMSGFPAGSKMAATDSFTVAGWIKLNSIDDRSPILTKEYKDKRGFEFAVKNGRLAAQIYKNETTGTSVSGFGTLLEQGRWYHVAMTYRFVTDGGSRIHFYLDGEEDYSMSTSVGPQRSNNAPVRVGAYIWSDTYQRFFNGMIDELFVFNKVLNPDQIKSLRDSGNQPVFTSNYAASAGNLNVYPNPSADWTQIEFRVEIRGHVGLRIYNAQGQLVENLVNQVLEEGMHNIRLETGKLSPGVYFCKLELGGRVEVVRLVR